MSTSKPQGGDAMKLAVIGAGAAGLSLCRMADQLPGADITLIDPLKPGQRQEHSWGFWRHEAAEEAFALARKTWSRWRITGVARSVEQIATRHPYACLESKAWLGECRRRARAAGCTFMQASVDTARGEGGRIILETSAEPVEADLVLDSRHGTLPPGTMLQHFTGWEVEAETACFDPECATLMDFRCDQSRGIHFIYVLPFTDRRALVESTMFSPATEAPDFYAGAIDLYCRQTLGSGDYMVLRREHGVIPMGFPVPRDKSLIGIGGNGGAVRPSSGYAFVFIQKQVRAVLSAMKTGSLSKSIMPKSITPHQPVDLWMDRIFLKVLRRFPGRAPGLFVAMARALSGDEMARFLSGEASLRLRLKVIMAMPKWPFLLALMLPEAGQARRQARGQVRGQGS